MQVFTFKGDVIVGEKFSSSKEIIKCMHNIGETYFSSVYDSREFTSDMDGVLIHDDNAMMVARIIAGSSAQEMFGKYSDLNIKVVSEGFTSYCWYAPTLFLAQLLEGLSPEINRIVGKNMRLIPGTKKYIDYLVNGLDYKITALTAGHQEAADEVSKRIGILNTIGTQLEVFNGVYDGTVSKFIGGFHKLEEVKKILNYFDGKFKGIHIGDSYSDVDTLKGVPNSIAFNPGCELALKNAKVSVIGTSLLGLLPFFDDKGKYDGKLEETDFPEMIIIMNREGFGEGIEKLLKESRIIKKIEIENILINEGNRDNTFQKIESKIREYLKEKKIDFQTKFKEFMSLEEFDEYAKKAYLELEQ